MAFVTLALCLALWQDGPPLSTPVAQYEKPTV